MKKQLFEGNGVVLRVGELYLKGGNRHLFMNAMVANVKRVFRDRDDISVLSGQGRIFLHGACDEDVLDRLRWVFGISSYSPVVFCKKDIEAITANAVSLATQFHGDADTVFRIAARRSDKSFSHTSAQLGVEVGSAVNVATGFGVDLEQPDLSIGIEVGREWTFLWTEQLKGGGGLPVGTSGRAALLLSGGIDSPVAGHMLQKRGVSLTGIYFHAFPYTSDGAKNKVIELAEVLAKRQKKFKLCVVPFAKVQEALRDAANPGYLVLLYRRAMIRIAERLAEQDGIKALATGENLGQVASQTLENMAAVEDAATMPILRPILAMDKIETINIARDIGTYDISIQPFEDCCTLFVPAHPETKGTAKTAAKFESRGNWHEALEEAIENTEVIML
ncbi:MAG: tRNA 4-thiouridine(8) synthase ThiI [Deltaproteobacteria bacterium]|nr:tRNA 4-thiouridine(8) synthase ThiI [Deltaproteobacteria bacterium]MBN2670333.1 tRNA 4-thiouridine(8) synthase ThiI [Deltaproteobacteria bacterium]